MKILRVHPTSIDERAIAEAVDALQRGEIIVYPTDSVYALGCDALNNRAIERLCRLKGINPERNMLSIVCDGLSQAATYAKIDNRAFAMLRQYLPGAVTFVLPAATTLPKVFKGRKQVGIRIPDSPVALRLAEVLGHPLMTTSISVAPEIEDAGEMDVEALEGVFGRTPEITLALDAGPSGLRYTTVVDLTDSTTPAIIREGIVDVPEAS